MTEYQGTENLLALAKRLREVAPNVRDAISMKLGASLMESAAIAAWAFPLNKGHSTSAPLANASASDSSRLSACS